MNENVLCTKTHEYVLDLGNNNYESGITDYAIEQLGDIVFIELPEIGSEFVKNEVFATIESVKAASEIYMPVSGKITEINEKLEKFKIVFNKVSLNCYSAVTKFLEQSLYFQIRTWTKSILDLDKEIKHISASSFFSCQNPCGMTIFFCGRVVAALRHQ